MAIVLPAHRLSLKSDCISTWQPQALPKKMHTWRSTVAEWTSWSRNREPHSDCKHSRLRCSNSRQLPPLHPCSFQSLENWSWRLPCSPKWSLLTTQMLPCPGSPQQPNQQRLRLPKWPSTRRFPPKWPSTHQFPQLPKWPQTLTSRRY
jgi:hypothetical protein